MHKSGVLTCPEILGGVAMAIAESTPKASQPQTGPLSVGARVSIGVLGGVCALLLKFYAHDRGIVGEWAFNLWQGTLSELHQIYFIEYILVAVVVIFFGGVIGYVSDERNKLKLLALGASAPALLTTLAGGIEVKKEEPGQADRASIEIQSEGQAVWFMGQIRLVSIAHAAESGDSTRPPRIGDGIRVFFGLQPVDIRSIDAERRYWVIVASERNRDDAEAVAASINASVPEFDAFVGARRPGNEFYPVIIGGKDAFVPYDEAMALRSRAVETGVADEDSYLSDFPDRLPQMQ